MLKVPTALLSQKPRWETITLPDGQSFKIQITPPDRAGFLEGRLYNRYSDAALARLQCVTDWFGPVEVTTNPDGSEASTRELPFSEDAFTVLLKSDREILDQVMAALGPYFNGAAKLLGEQVPATSQAPASQQQEGNPATAPAAV
ncbi:MAG TPA: hypothetical protein VM165_12650 [Planctomycetaceae bacterium]|nr:hypothetical protein [Planctomycetaceae bacterium]